CRLVEPAPQLGHFASTVAFAWTVHLPWPIVAFVTRIPGPGSHRGLISIRPDVGALIRRKQPRHMASTETATEPFDVRFCLSGVTQPTPQADPGHQSKRGVDRVRQLAS